MSAARRQVHVSAASLGALCVTILLCPLLCHTVLASTSIPLSRDHIVVDETGVRNRCICPGPSRRNLIRRDFAGSFTPGHLAAGVAEFQTLKVLGIRVEFPGESPDDSLTTGLGRFDLRDTLTFLNEEGHNLDSAPHNRRYFEAHLRALGIYWNVVSNGRLSLDNTVLPVALDSAYQMPMSMGYYGTQIVGDSSVIVDRLRQFVIDAATVASADPAVTFTNYDAVFIFHAGPDGQTDIAGDSPHDLFSAFLTLDGPLLLRNGTDTLTEATIMPETETQDGRISLLNGVMAHEFGHQLGLVDLYNTNFASPFAFATQLGNFSLMDNNGIDLAVEAEVAGQTRFIFNALPVFPDAWSRAYLGFVDVADAVNEDNVLVWMAEGEEAIPVNRQVWRVPISETEYYLIENRLNDPDGQLSALRLDSLTNVVLGPADTLTIPGLPPQLNRKYDFLLPGSGILIWHVDEGVAALDYVPDDGIDNNFFANTLQWDHDRRFVRLVEASGFERLGSSGIFRFYTGSSADYWSTATQTELSTVSLPPVHSNTGATPQIRIYGISSIAQSMGFNVRSRGVLDGFPVYVGSESDLPGSITVTDVAPDGASWRTPGDGQPEIFTGYKNYVLATGWDGNPLTAYEVSDTTFDYDTSMVTRTIHPVAVGLPTDPGWIGEPLVQHFESEPSWLVAVAQNGRVYRWKMTDVDDNQLFDMSPIYNISPPPVAAPILWDHADVGPSRVLFVPTASGTNGFIDLVGVSSEFHQTIPLSRGMILSAAGQSQSDARAVYRNLDSIFVGTIAANPTLRQVDADTLLAPVIGDIDRAEDNGLELIVVDPAGYLWVFNEVLEPLDPFPVALGFVPQGPPVLADVDRDSYLDIILVGDDGRYHAYARNGVLVPNFPMSVGLSYRPDTATATPIVVDFDQSDVLTLVGGGSSRLLSGRNGRGAMEDNMPRPLGGALQSTPAWAFNALMTQAAVFARADDGYLYAFEVPAFGGDDIHTIWPAARHDERGTSATPIEDLEPVIPASGFFDTERAFVYPNPASDEAIVRYWLGSDASVSIAIFDLAGNRVSEWTGSGTGGVFNEWTWPCANAASGVYFARVEATPKTGGSAEHVFCKLSVIQ